MLIRNRQINNSYIIPFTSINLIFKREINSQALSPKSSSPSPSTGKVLDQNIPDISTKSDDVSQETLDAVSNISNNDSPVRFTLNVKRKFSEISNAGPSEEITSNSISETTSQADIQKLLLEESLKSYNISKNKGFELIDDLNVNISLLEDYFNRVKVNIKEIDVYLFDLINNNTLGNILDNTEDITRGITLENTEDVTRDISIEGSEDVHGDITLGGSEDVPRLMSDFDSNSLSSDDSIFPSNNLTSIDFNIHIGMEPLNNGVASSDALYSYMQRFDYMVHNNYKILMKGIDNVDYRVGYEYLIDSLNILDQIIIEQHILVQLENIILPLYDKLEIQSYTINNEIINTFNLLYQFP
jgi:hypothetical protein